MFGLCANFLVTLKRLFRDRVGIFFVQCGLNVMWLLEFMDYKCSMVKLMNAVMIMCVIESIYDCERHTVLSCIIM
jgi:hypothetical protein